jgi:hypothetical protein
VENFPEGYPQLAAFLNSDDSFAIFRKFSRTNTRILLHLQAEIQALEMELDLLDREDGKTSGHKKGWDTKQQGLVGKLQEKMVIYCKHLTISWDDDGELTENR